MEIPVALVGVDAYAQIAELAGLLRRPPVRILRAALASGLFGREPVLSAAALATVRAALEELPEGFDGGPISGTIGPDSGPLGAG